MLERVAADFFCIYLIGIKDTFIRCKNQNTYQISPISPYVYWQKTKCFSIGNEVFLNEKQYKSDMVTSFLQKIKKKFSRILVNKKDASKIKPPVVTQDNGGHTSC